MSLNNSSVVITPFQPTERQWSGLARDIVQWMRAWPRQSGKTLFKHLDLSGTPIPAWLREEVEDTDHTIDKGTIATIIYKAMLAEADQFFMAAPRQADAVELLTEQLNRAGVACTNGSVRLALAYTLSSGLLVLTDAQAEKVETIIGAEAWRNQLGPGGVAKGRALQNALMEAMRIPVLPQKEAANAELART